MIDGLFDQKYLTTSYNFKDIENELFNMVSTRSGFNS